MKTTDEIFNSFCLKGNISKVHAKEIKMILERYLKEAYDEGYSRATALHTGIEYL